MDTASAVISGTAVAVGLGVWAVTRRWRSSLPAITLPEPAAVTVDVPVRCWPAATLDVMTGAAIIDKTSTQRYIDDTRQCTGLNGATWDQLVQPVILAVAELVQLLPASESHHHADPGGLWTHIAETMNFAARLRNGRLLPDNIDSEERILYKHQWTVAVILAALIHDVGKVVTDLRVTIYSATYTAGKPWQALAGNMLESGAEAYGVEFPAAADRDYTKHQRLGVVLLQRLVPTATMSWLSNDPNLLQILMTYLGQEGAKSPLQELVSLGEQESVRKNLASGPRTRFASAKVTPLIERLMTGLRRLLEEGGTLPLNRAGAAGWVFEEDIWFASTRLANEVRDYLTRNESAKGIPGEDKNDRLYDTWQEYGACIVNPETGGAIWAAKVELPDWSVDMNGLLRFPLATVFAPDRMPAQMPGKISVINKKIVPPVATTSSVVVPPVPAAASSTATPPQAKGIELPAPAVTANPIEDQVAEVNDDLNPDAEPALDTLPVEPADITTIESDSVSEPVDEPVAEITSTTMLPSPSQPVPDGMVEPTPAARVIVTQEMYLDDVLPADIPVVQVSGAAPTLSILPVTPAVSLPTAKTGKGEPTEAALRFMGWIQRGIGDGTLTYNVSGALIHFVTYQEQTMMLIVSPMAFRNFATTFGEEGEGKKADAATEPMTSDRLGLGIQGAFNRAGWHLPTPKGKNIFSFQIMRNGGQGGNLLNGFLIPDPARFVNPVPAANERLVFWANTLPAKPAKS